MTQNTIRSVVQRLESLQRAGITHLKKTTKRSAPPRAEGCQAKQYHPSAAQPPAASHESASTPANPRCAELSAAARDVAACTRCAELARTRTQTVFGAGNPYARLIFCGEAPGADEDRLGEPFVGRAGQLLTDIIVKGMKMRRQDVYILNILRCRPPGNRNPLPIEAANCREHLERQLAIIQPEFICCLGAVAAQNLLGTEETIGRLRGRILDFHGIKVVCTYHPAYLLRNPPAKRAVWDDIQMLMAEMKKKAEGGGRRAEEEP
jgi:DNA polymerase